MKLINKSWAIVFIVYFLIIGLIIILAYLDKLSNSPGERYYFDKIMHFILFGLLAYLLHRTLNRKTYGPIPVGPLLIVIFCIFDEVFQVLSSNRTSDIYDLIADLLGILFFIGLDWLIIYLKRPRYNQ